MSPQLSPDAAKVIGYFSGPDQQQPAYDPGPQAPCPICGGPISAAAPRTISLLPAKAQVSIFYRVHQLCDELQDPEEAEALDGRMLDLALGSDWMADVIAQEEAQNGPQAP